MRSRVYVFMTLDAGTLFEEMLCMVISDPPTTAVMPGVTDEASGSRIYRDTTPSFTVAAAAILEVSRPPMLQITRPARKAPIAAMTTQTGTVVTRI
jgi:hypothetical protein